MVKRWYERAVHEAAGRLARGGEDAVADEHEGPTGLFRRAHAGILKNLAVYAAVGTTVMAATPARAFAAGPGALDITNVSSILDFLGNICIVVGVVLAGWNVVQAAQTAKETQGLQIDRSFWGIIGGVGMAIGGAAIKTAGSLWRYGNAG